MSGGDCSSYVTCWDGLRRRSKAVNQRQSEAVALCTGCEAAEAGRCRSGVWLLRRSFAGPSVQPRRGRLPLLGPGIGRPPGRPSWRLRRCRWEDGSGHRPWILRAEVVSPPSRDDPTGPHPAATGGSRSPPARRSHRPPRHRQPQPTRPRRPDPGPAPGPPGRRRARASEHRGHRLSRRLRHRRPTGLRRGRGRPPAPSRGVRRDRDRSCAARAEANSWLATCFLLR